MNGKAKSENCTDGNQEEGKMIMKEEMDMPKIGKQERMERNFGR